MTNHDRDRWNARYSEQELPRGDSPSNLLVDHAPPAQDYQRAIDLACGRGRHAFYLASLGYQVDAIDISDVALNQARAEMQRRGINNINFQVADLDTVDLPPETYDLVCVFYFLDRRLLPRLKRAVRPGGLVIYETVNVGWLARHKPTRPEYLLQYGELPQLFDGWRTLLAEDDEYASRYVGRKSALV